MPPRARSSAPRRLADSSRTAWAMRNPRARRSARAERTSAAAVAARRNEGSTSGAQTAAARPASACVRRAPMTRPCPAPGRPLAPNPRDDPRPPRGPRGRSGRSAASCSTSSIRRAAQRTGDPPVEDLEGRGPRLGRAQLDLRDPTGHGLSSLLILLHAAPGPRSRRRGGPQAPVTAADCRAGRQGREQ